MDDVIEIPDTLWSGGVRDSYVSMPQMPHVVVDTYTSKWCVSFWSYGKPIPAVLAIYDAKTGTVDGKASGEIPGMPGRPSVPYENPIAGILDSVFHDPEDFLDALHEATGVPVVSTVTGGTYRLRRGVMPSGRRIYVPAKRQWIPYV